MEFWFYTDKIQMLESSPAKEEKVMGESNHTYSTSWMA